MHIHWARTGLNAIAAPVRSVAAHATNHFQQCFRPTVWFALLCVLGWTPAAHAQWTWNSTTSGSFSGNNWTTAAPGNNFNNTFTFTNNGNNNVTVTNDLTSGTATSITFTNDGSATKRGSFVITGSAIALGGNITTTAIAAGGTAITDEISLNMNMTAGRTFTANAGHSLILSGSLSSGNTRQTFSSGTNSSITLSGNNTFAALTVSAGTVNASRFADTGQASNLGIGGTVTNPHLLGNTAEGTINYTGTATSSNYIFQFGNANANAGGARITNNGSGTLTLTSSTLNKLIAGTADRVFTIGGTSNGVIQGIIQNNDAASRISLVKSDAGTWTLSGANTYTGSTTITSGTLQIGNGGTTGSLSGSSAITNNATLVFNRSNSITQGTDFSTAGISGLGSLIQAGAGLLTLSAANTYTGATQVNAGVLALGASNVLSGSTAVTVAGGELSMGSNSDTVASFAITSGSVTGSGKLTAGTYALGGGTVAANLGDGTLTVTANSTLNGTSDATTVSLNAGALTLGGGGTRFTSNLVAVSGSTGASLSLGGNETFGSLAGAANVAVGNNTLSVGSANTSTTHSGTISGAGGLTKLGSGTFTLSGANTYGGATQVNAGVLALGASNVLSGSTAVTVAGGELNMGSNSDTVASFAITSGSVTGSGKLTAGTYALGGGTVAANLGGGTLTVTANSTLNGTSDATTVSLNAGALTLGSGGTRFTSNLVAVSGSAGASLSLGGNETFGSLVGAANVALGSNTLSVGSANASTLYSGVLSGSGGLTKLGSGTFTLSGTSSYSGATAVSAGILAVNGQIASAVAVAAGATLGGSGVIGGALSGDGLVSPGNSPGILAASQFVPTGGLDAAFELTGFTPVYNAPSASGNDILRLTDLASPFAAGSFSSANVIDVYFNVDTIASGQVYEGGFFTGLSAASLLTALDGQAQFVYWTKTGTGGTRVFNGVNYVSLTSLPGITGATLQTAYGSKDFGGTVGSVSGSVTQFIIVPEPAAVVIAGVGIGAIVSWSRSRRRRRVSSDASCGHTDPTTHASA